MTERTPVATARSRRLGMAAFAIIALLMTVALPFWASAATFRSESDITIAVGETVVEDLVAAGDTFTLSGTAERDVFVAARSVDVDGTVEGSLSAAAADITISGTVEHSVRVASGTANISGTISGDLLVLGGVTTIASGGTVEGDVHVYGGELQVDGTVDGDIGGSIGTLGIEGEVGGDVNTEVERLDIGNAAAIAGALTYVSPSDGDIASGAEIGGEIDRQSVAPWGMESGFRARFFSPLVRTLWLLVTGAFIIAVAPRLATALNEVMERPLPATLAGIMALIGVPIAVIVLMITVIGLPISLLLLAAYLAALYLSQYVVGQRIGAWLLPRSWDDGSRGHLLLSMTIGVLLLSVLRYVPVPFIGTIVNALVAIVGLGAAVLVFGRLRPRYIVARA